MPVQAEQPQDPLRVKEIRTKLQNPLSTQSKSLKMWEMSPSRRLQLKISKIPYLILILTQKE
jgi:hypothetical protein